MRKVGERTATVAGQAVELLTFEGTDANGVVQRSLVSSAFLTDRGSALVFFGGPADTWEDSLVDDFLGSIHR
jgi:hypothetical protein